MGQSKSRKKELDAFLSSLSRDEQIIFNLAQKAYDRIIRALNFQGACYHMTLLHKTILLKEFKIEADAIIGFVNDGTDNLMISHGWLEYRGRKVDVAISNPNYGQQPGPLLILDYKFQQHNSSDYSYDRTRGSLGDQAIEELLASEYPQVRMMAEQKEAEHAFMTKIADSEDRIVDYLDNAPAGMTYDRFLKILI